MEISAAKSDNQKLSLDDAMPQVYEELRRLASSYLSQERGDHTLQPTALVNETYLRLISQYSVDFSNRAHLLAGSAPAVPAQGRFPRPDRMPAVHTGPRAGDASAGAVLQDPLLPAARAGRLRGVLDQTPHAQAAELPVQEADRGAAVRAVPLPLTHRHRPP